ncbi:MAG: DNA polymerase III subunit alpha [Tannerella sp.]|jgi:DNA polymerase-3 subunit alpha|nr:DNA polymerase III subunit alpha [Tannerella sp.]
MEPFVHLHVHTQYSLLDGQASIDALLRKATDDGMKALAVTDHGNMFGIKEFYNKVKKLNSECRSLIKHGEKELKDLEAAEPSQEKEERVRLLTEQIRENRAKLFKPILGCECYCAHNGRESKKTKDDYGGWHLIVLAKNLTGYRNLIKMVSLSWTEGFYMKPRIDRALLEKYHEGLIVTSACLGGEIPRKLMGKNVRSADDETNGNGAPGLDEVVDISESNIKQAEEAVLWFKNLFGDDYYLELQRHETNKENADRKIYPKQVEVNNILIEFARKHDIKLIATNDVHFVNEEDAEAHDRLICLSTGKDYDDPKRMRYSQQEWMKTTAEMNAIFADIPEALANTLEIADKVEFYSIDSAPLMPFFEIDAAFGTEEGYREKYTEADLISEFGEDNYNRLGGYDKVIRIKLEADYLTHLTMQQVGKHYGENLSDELKSRIDFELDTMKKMGFPGYFLIVQDFIAAARKMGVSVGPGRGSAAGSVVAYCLGITNIDPIKYDLLFERFLNPDRISMPDIDIDFDDDGRSKVLKYVTEKYGQNRVAHIITYNSMAAKMAIKDVARVEKLPLNESDRLAKLVPERIPDRKLTLKNAIEYVPELKDAANSKDPELGAMLRSTLKYAQQLEGNVRNTGVHACGIIIGRQDISDIVPVSTAEDKESGETMLVTQYEGSVIEDTGLIKMDFLGLRNLSIIKEAVDNIEQTTGKRIDIDLIPMDDKKTYELFCQGKTTGIFQFESPGMQKYLKELEPSKFEDLIAMNALFRPGPMDYIPSFIARKHGREEITYDIPVMKRYLEDTYGITVYQEQVMLLSRLLANFTGGESDTLRKAMGKKMIDKMNEMKEKFITGGKANGHNPAVLEKIWRDWEKFAQYAFNKSHATCYSWIAYQTAYLKANYPSEYMAAVLSQNRSNIKDITKSMDDCKEMKIQVLGPDVNESVLKFGVNKEGNIRFGLGAIKGVGESAVANILEERKKDGPFKDVYDFMERVNLFTCNKKSIDSLALAGAFDSFNIRREPFAIPNNKGETFSETLIRYGRLYQEDKVTSKNSLFGDTAGITISKPVPPPCESWNTLDRLNKEKELVGMYLSAHPLDAYRIILTEICNTGVSELNDKAALKGKEILFGGIVTGFREGVGKNNRPYAFIKMEDFSGSGEIALFGKDYIDYGKYCKTGLHLFVRASVQPRPYKETELDLKISSIQQLQDVKNNLIAKITIVLPVNLLDENTIAELSALIKKNPGNTQLFFKLTDGEQQVSINLFSKSIRLEVTQQLIDFLNESVDIKYSINK